MMVSEGQFILRLFAAFIAGAIIGLEREIKEKGAGIRTYSVVCMSSALIMILACYCFNDTHSGDIARLGAAGITGFSFLGAGLIIKDGGRLINITTAALLWSSCVLGLAIGYGLYLISGVFLVLIIIIQYIMIRIEVKLNHKKENAFHRFINKTTLKKKIGG